jgi:GT2 family glycosyltransferase
MSAPTASAVSTAEPARERAGAVAAGDRAPVAAVVLTYNEERNLPECLASLADWVDELFVVDSGSTDRTLEIARDALAVGTRSSTTARSGTGRSTTCPSHPRGRCTSTRTNA